MPFDEKKYHLHHILRTEKYQKRIARIYDEYTKEFTRLGESVPYNPNKLFAFYSYPQTHERVKKLMSDMVNDIRMTTTNGITKEWELSNQKNDALIHYVFKGSNLSKKELSRYMQRNEDALKAFQKRKVGGLTLSQRVWKQTDQFKREIELALDVGLGEGKSAAALSRDVRKNLREPDRLFRRIRNKKGKLIPSKAMKAFHPGQGVYRSSYKNALRMTATETNMAYRSADHARRQQLDFVVGIEVHTSNAHPQPDMCDDLAGKYPKDFEFAGWHPNCMCFTTSILKTNGEMARDDKRILEGKEPLKSSKNKVYNPHAGFKNWVKDNEGRIKKAKQMPYFLKDNPKEVGKALGKKSSNSSKLESKDSFIPKNLNEYNKKLGVKPDNEIFNHLKKPVKFSTQSKKGAYFDSNANKVVIPIDQRRKNSKWYSKAVVHHEFGHAIDFQNEIYKSDEIKSLMNKYKKKYIEDGTFKKVEAATLKDYNDAVRKGYHTKKEKVLAVADTLKSLNKSYGGGHSDRYFTKKWNSEKEFIAHSFENIYSGNEFFEKYMPDLYNETKDVLRGILSKLK